MNNDFLLPEYKDFQLSSGKRIIPFDDVGHDIFPFMYNHKTFNFLSDIR